MNKKYMILHIESGNYLEIMKGYQCWTVTNTTELPVFLSFFVGTIRKVGIAKQDYGVYNSNKIYFKDRATAQTFLRDLYLSEYNENVDFYRTFHSSSSMKKHNRNMYEIVELDNV